MSKPRVRENRNHVGRQNKYHVGPAEDHSTGLHQRQVARLHAVHHELGESGVGEDRLHDDHAAHEVREIQRIATDYLESRGSITTYDLTQLVGISSEQARYFFKRMVIAGEYRRIGVTSGTKYVPGGG